MKRAEFINMLEKNPQLKKDLFIRGFLITDKRIKDTSTFPFYGKSRKVPDIILWHIT